MFAFPSRLSCHATRGPALEFLTTTACCWSIAVAGVLSLTRAGAWNVAPLPVPPAYHTAFPFQNAEKTWVPLMSKETYFLSTAELSIIPVAPFTRAYVPPPFVEYTARISLWVVRFVLKKCAPVMILGPSTAIEGHTKAFDAQVPDPTPHMIPSWEKKPGGAGLNRNQVTSHAVLS